MKITDEILETVIKELQKEKVESIEIEVVGFENNGLASSKFFGMPYIGRDKEVPVGEDGKQLVILAQINCEELPENNIYPKKGLLQFWVGRDDLAGLDIEDPTSNKNSRVVYYPEIDPTVSVDDVVNKYELPTISYIFEEAFHELKFTKKMVTRSAYTYDFPNVFKAKLSELYPEFVFEEDTELYEILEGEQMNTLFDSLDAQEHRLGGTPYFAQFDPRIKYPDYTVQLLQIDSDGVAGIEWGDSGVANFFITKEMLEQLDFSKVLYTWDCY